MQQTFSKLLAQKQVTAADLLVELHNLKLESLTALGEHRMRLHKVCLLGSMLAMVHTMRR